jgi:hypothetical protein
MNRWVIVDLKFLELGKELNIVGSNKFRIYQNHDEDDYHEFMIHNEHMISNYILRYF